MSIYKDISNWYSSKEERGKLGALYADGPSRLHNIYTMGLEKKKIVKEIQAMTIDPRFRGIIFRWFNDLRWSKTFDKSQARRMIIAIRRMRFHNGNPLVFSEFDCPFWADVHSKFIPEDDFAIARGLMVFEEVTVMASFGDFRNVVQNIESQREHHGYWSAKEHEELDDVEDSANRPKPHPNKKHPQTLYFNHLSDMIEFRLRYEFERV